MTEQERLKAINVLNDWRRESPDVIALMIAAVLKHHDQPSVGHLARFHPDAFDDLYEEAEAFMSEDL